MTSTKNSDSHHRDGGSPPPDSTPKPDRRVTRTKRLLRQALMELVREKDYARITVQDILDRADVGRSTFYTHYRDKDDLLLGDMAFILPLWDDPSDEVVPNLLPLFVHVREFYPTLRQLTLGGAGPMMFERIRTALTKRWQERLEELQSRGCARDLPAEPAAHFATSGFISLLTWWINSGVELEPAQMHALVRDAICSGLGASTATR
ncbi:MAG: TetR/AcrR family transcriptional regulator [Acidobacteriota bacterium]